MNHNDWFKAMKAKSDSERQQQLERARSEAVTSGKEPFELDVLDRLWRDNPDMRLMSQGLDLTAEERIADWSERYYVQYPEIRTMSEFVAQMQISQSHGFFD